MAHNLLDWDDEEYDERIHIRMGASGTRRTRWPARSFTTPTYTQFRRGCDGCDADCEGKRTSTVKNPGDPTTGTVPRISHRFSCHTADPVSSREKGGSNSPRSL